MEAIKRLFEGDWGAINQIEQQIERTQKQLAQIQASTRMNAVERRVETEIQQIYLGDLKLAGADVEKLYYRYVPPDQRTK